VSGLGSDGQIKLELRRQLILTVEPVGEVDASEPTVGINGEPLCLDITGAIGSSREVGQIEANLIPALV